MGVGGGLFVVTPAAVEIDAFTVANIINNTASTGEPNIAGPYTVIA
jgi:hypothetical protein